MAAGRRVCFLGESFVAGVGDQACLGWVGRLALRAIVAGYALTWYNLGIRRETSAGLRTRWEPECTQRLGAEEGRVVVSTGVNDTMHDNGLPRVPPTDSRSNLATILAGVRQRGWHALVVGPPPNIDEHHNNRLSHLDDLFVETCADLSVPYLPVYRALRQNQVWMRDIAATDGYHPGSAGYEHFAELVAPSWLTWLADPAAML